jgi:hypothetical protein
MPSRPHTIRSFGPVIVAIVALAPLLCAGCGHKTVQAAVPVVTPPSPDVRPMTIAPDTDAAPPLEVQETAPPELPASSESTAVNIAPSRIVPPPRKPSTAPAPSEESNEQDAAAKPQPPRIAPQLSAGDQAAYQRRIEDDASVANKNLQTVSGRQLNATQQDLADKVRSFLTDSIDAGKDGDWARAQNLAQKARVLSVELINSL